MPKRTDTKKILTIGFGPIVIGRLFSVQYHPEDSHGPYGARYLFDDFASLMQEHLRAS